MPGPILADFGYDVPGSMSDYVQQRNFLLQFVSGPL